MGKFGNGRAVRRVEDPRFVTGSGRYTDDICLPDQAWLHFFRSPYAHGVITELDVAAAKNIPGVLAVYTGDTLQAAGVRDLPGAGLPDRSRGPLRQPPLARGIVRYVGEPVVAVVADSAAAAREAAEAVFLDVEELPAVCQPRSALADDARAIHETRDGNLFGTATYGDREQAGQAFRKAARVVSVDIVNNRVAPVAMEPRACNVVFDPASGDMTLYQGCQGAHALRDRLASCLDIDADKVRVVCPDVGGGFGLKFFLQCETVVAAHASMQLGRPVKWTADRSESFMADLHGRDHASQAELALDDDGRFLGLRVAVDAAIGAYCSQAGPFIPWFGACMSTGCYDIPALYAEVRLVVTNTVPVDAYRGAGRPEATYLIERLVDRAAAELGVGRDEIRRRNFIRPEQFPYTTPSGRSYDSGDYARILDAALGRADWHGFGTRREASASDGKLRGIGLAYYVEICSAAGYEDTHIAFDEAGRVTVLAGTQSTGQGHETTFAQIAAAELGIALDRIDVVQGDTARVPGGQGTNGSRSMAIGGSSLQLAARALCDAGRQVAAGILDTPPDRIGFSDGRYRNDGSDRSVSLAEVAAASFDEARRPADVAPGLASSARFTPDGGTFPNGCHVCEVEIDPDTGGIRVCRYTVEDDVGTVLNPQILEGQIVGGVAQGLGQALLEHAVYEDDSGQLLTATFMDYGMPRADWMPAVDFRYQEIPSPRNPLGVKGAGEAGTVGAAPALVSAVLDALSPHGIEHIDMPLTPRTVWHALHKKKRPR